MNHIFVTNFFGVLKIYFYIFRRSGSDLVLRMEIELVEALCGFQKVIKTLDDRSLVVTAIPGKI